MPWTVVVCVVWIGPVAVRHEVRHGGVGDVDEDPQERGRVEVRRNEGTSGRLGARRSVSVLDVLAHSLSLPAHLFPISYFFFFLFHAAVRGTLLLQGSRGKTGSRPGHQQQADGCAVSGLHKD